MTESTRYKGHSGRWKKYPGDFLEDDLQTLGQMGDSDLNKAYTNYDKKTYHQGLDCSLELLLQHSITTCNTPCINKLLFLLEVPEIDSQSLPLTIQERITYFFLNKPQ